MKYFILFCKIKIFREGKVERRRWRVEGEGAWGRRRRNGKGKRGRVGEKGNWERHKKEKWGKGGERRAQVGRARHAIRMRSPKKPTFILTISNTRSLPLFYYPSTHKQKQLSLSLSLNFPLLSVSVSLILLHLSYASRHCMRFLSSIEP